MGSSQTIVCRTVKESLALGESGEGEGGAEMMQPTCQSFQSPRRRSSITRPAVCRHPATGCSSENPELSEEKPIGLCLSGRLMRQPIWHCEDTSADIRRGWPIIISLHFLSGLQSSCLSSGCCMISTVQDQQPWHADSQNLQAPLILNDSSCIAETVLFVLLSEGCLKVAD